MFGVGSAIIMTPALVYFLEVDQHTAQGKSVTEWGYFSPSRNLIKSSRLTPRVLREFLIINSGMGSI